MKPTVTEQTSKKYKGRMLAGGLACCVGVVMMIGGYSATGALAFLGGLVWYLIARGSAWWNHG